MATQYRQSLPLLSQVLAPAGLPIVGRVPDHLEARELGVDLGGLVSRVLQPAKVLDLLQCHQVGASLTDQLDDEIASTGPRIVVVPDVQIE